MFDKVAHPHAALAPDQLRKSCCDFTLVGRRERSVGTKFSDVELPCLSERAWLKKQHACLPSAAVT